MEVEQQQPQPDPQPGSSPREMDVENSENIPPSKSVNTALTSKIPLPRTNSAPTVAQAQIARWTVDDLLRNFCREEKLLAVKMLLSVFVFGLFGCLVGCFCL
jgi:hypothetical protein